MQPAYDYRRRRADHSCEDGELFEFGEDVQQVGQILYGQVVNGDQGGYIAQNER